VLDCDLFVDAAGTPIDLGSLQSLASSFSRRSYAFFRWMVTEAFLKAHGAQP